MIGDICTHLHYIHSQELATPKASEPENGFIVPNIELTPLCSPKFRPGAPSDEAQVYSRLLADIITNSNCVNCKDLCIVKEKLVWTLYCDMSCLDHDGSVLDAAIIALIAALKTRKILLQSSGKLSKTTAVISFLFF